jgi:hypothetical protein
VIVKVPFILKRTQPSILILRIYNSGTISFYLGRCKFEVGKDTYYPESSRHVIKGSNHGEIVFLLSSSWPSSMKVKMRNFLGPRWIKVQQLQ